MVTTETRTCSWLITDCSAENGGCFENRGWKRSGCVSNAGFSEVITFALSPIDPSSRTLLHGCAFLLGFTASVGGGGQQLQHLILFRVHAHEL